MRILTPTLKLFLLSGLVRLGTVAAVYMVYGDRVVELAGWYDGAHYLQIAETFPLLYQHPYVAENLRYYPLFPVIVSMVNALVGNALLSAHLVGVISSSLAASVFYRIARHYSPNAYQLGLIFSCFPPKWLHVSVFLFSEPVFILAILAAAWSFNQKRYAAGFLFTGLAMVTRPVGVIFLLSFVLWYLADRKKIDGRLVGYCLSAVVPFVLLHLYLYAISGQVQILAHTGVQGGWGGKVFSFPLVGLVNGMADSGILWVRKGYVAVMFLYYIAGVIGAAHFWLRRRDVRFICLMLPYFLFCLCLEGINYNWWMMSITRFLLPLAPFCMLILLQGRTVKLLRILFFVSIGAGFAYVLGSIWLHLQYGKVV